MGYQLLGKTRVQEYLSERMLKREQRTEITQDKVLADIEKVKQHFL